MIKNKKLYLSALCLSLSLNNAYAFDFEQFVKDIFSDFTFAGSKSVNEKDKEKEKENNKIVKENKNKSDINKKPEVTEIADNSILRQEKKCFSHYPWGPPQSAQEDKVNNWVYLCKKGFAIGYDLDKKNAIWVSEHLIDRNLILPKKMTDYKFELDPEIPVKYQATFESYSKSIYDRGQLIAGENLTNKDVERKEAFYMTNLLPQVGVGLNRGIWMELEMWTREQVKSRGALYITTGPLYLGKVNKLSDGTYIPSHFYKIVIDYQIGEAISFIIPNKEIITVNSPENSKGYACEDKGKTVCSLFDFSTSIKEVERVSGLRFITGISDTHVIRVKVSDDFVNPRRYLKSTRYK